MAEFDSPDKRPDLTERGLFQTVKLHGASGEVTSPIPDDTPVDSPPALMDQANSLFAKLDRMSFDQRLGFVGFRPPGGPYLPHHRTEKDEKEE